MPEPGLTVNPPIAEVVPEAPLQEGAIYAEALPEEIEAPAAQVESVVAPEAPEPPPQLAQLQQELERYRQTEAIQALEGQAAQYAQQLVQAGWQPEQAQAEAKRELRIHLLEMAVEHHKTQSLNVLKAQAAQYLAQKHGVSARDLMMAQTPQDMESLAQKLGNRERETKDLKDRLGRVEGRMAPPQQYDSNRGSQRGVRVTAENIDVLYNQGRVTDAVYRRFLETGRI